MTSARQKTTVCETCGATIDPTGSGDLGCLACLLDAAMQGAYPERDAPDDDPPETIGPYRIRRREDGRPWILGTGAMGITYCAEDISLQRSVALKLINADFGQRGSEARERFLREARAAASLHHPHVATIYQFGIEEESGRCFFAMEFIDGETLEQRVQHHGPLPVAAVLEIARQIAAALIAAEQHRLVHRDLKPANIMLATEEKSDRHLVKIIDFGLAKALGESADARTLTNGAFVGTPAFASPEQLRRVPVDVRSDIYSLGATLWYLLTGHMPFGDEATAGPPLAQLKAARVPSTFVSLLVSMLALEPAARPRPAEIVAQLAAPPQRYWRLPWLGAVGVLLLTLILGGYLYLAPRPAKVSPVPPPPDKSVAVLPFENLRGEKESAGFAAGVHDALLSDLAHIADLKVISRTSVLQYRSGEPRNLREIGRQLSVAYIVEGTIQIAGKKMRLSAQLIDTRTDTHRWAQTYDRSLDDLFAVESEIAQTIAEQLNAEIAPNEKAEIENQPTHDLDAFSLYTRANSLLADTAFNPRGKANLLLAAQLLAEAVARDPNFLLAWCRLANAHDSLYFLGFDRTPWRLSLGESAVNTALKLLPEAGEAHLARGRHLYQGYLAYDAALAELGIARRTLPNDPGVFTLAGYIYRRQGKWEESTREFENAVALDPRNTFLLQQTSISYNLLRRYNDTAIILDRALLIAPNDIALRLSRAQVDLDWHAETRPLHAVLSTILAKAPAAAPDLAGAWLFVSFCERDPAAIDKALAALGDGSFGPDAIQLRRIFWEGLAAKMRGDKAGAQQAFSAARAEEARKVAAAPDFAPALCMLALMDAALGDKDQALREGRRAVEMLPVSRDSINGAHMIEFLALTSAWIGEPALACDQLEVAAKIPGTLSYGQLKLSPMWDELRGNPRFEKILATLAPDR
ncbi:MAG TPA: protein kinase [Chthoniobacterales bacterium]|jgi:serine/threonine-protein kinase